MFVIASKLPRKFVSPRQDRHENAANEQNVVLLQEDRRYNVVKNSINIDASLPGTSYEAEDEIYFSRWLLSDVKIIFKISVHILEITISMLFHKFYTILCNKF